LLDGRDYPQLAASSEINSDYAGDSQNPHPPWSGSGGLAGGGGAGAILLVLLTDFGALTAERTGLAKPGITDCP